MYNVGIPCELSLESKQSTRTDSPCREHNRAIAVVRTCTHVDTWRCSLRAVYTHIETWFTAVLVEY